MLVEYEHTKRRRKADDACTPDVDRCRFRFSLEQVRTGIEAVRTGPFTKPRRRFVEHLRQLLAEFETTLVSAAEVGRDRLEVSAEHQQAWVWVFRSCRSTGNYMAVSCERCGREYAPAEIIGQHESLDNIHGTGCRCAAGHLLFIDWKSIS